MLLASTETLHGIARTVLLVPRVGKLRAVQISGVTGSLLAFGLCYLLVPGIGAVGWLQHLLLGLGLAGFMAAFDVAIGRWVMRLKWGRIAQDFNPKNGNFLLFGLLFLTATPSLVAWMRGGSAG